MSNILIHSRECFWHNIQRDPRAGYAFRCNACQAISMHRHGTDSTAKENPFVRDEWPNPFQQQWLNGEFEP
jgi:hypothetical protein